MSYFDWLCMIVMPDGYRRVEYTKLLSILMDTEFYWIVSRDENRARDGLELRDIYSDEVKEDCDTRFDFGSPCSVFEMLTALAIRCNDELMYNPDDPKRADQWFWMFLENLGLDNFKNTKWTQQTQTDILDTLDGFMSKSVHFCPFSFPKAPPNFEKMELWYQLNHYIMWRFNENFN